MKIKIATAGWTVTVSFHSILAPLLEEHLINFSTIVWDPAQDSLIFFEHIKTFLFFFIHILV